MNKRVVITGLGVVAPNGTGLASFSSAITNGKSGIKFIQELKDFNFACKIGGIPNISDSNYLKYLSKYELDEADTSIKYAVIAGLEAWTDAGLIIPDYQGIEPHNDFGVIVGTCYGGTEIFIRKIYPLVSSGKTKRLGSQIVEHWMPSGSAAALSKIFSLANQTTANSSACSTGIEAISMAYQRIKTGEAKLMLAGGTDPYSPYAWAGFDSMRLLCRPYNETPETASRPMSNSAKGFVPAAGSGILILEELEHAKKRNAKIYAEIVGASINAGGQKNGGTMTSPNSKRVIDCIQQAITNANIKGKEIDLICGHLTGTITDSQEVKNWKDALNIKNKFPYINALKSMTGHMIGAAGAVETIAAVLQVYGNFIHPSINCEDLNPEIEKIWSRDKIPQKAISNIELQYIVKAGFGFGDVNSCLVLKKF